MEEQFMAAIEETQARQAAQEGHGAPHRDRAVRSVGGGGPEGGASKVLAGRPVVALVGMGPAFVYAPFACDVQERRHDGTGVEDLVSSFREARDAALSELDALEARVARRGGDAAGDAGAFVSVQREILEDAEVEALVASLIRDGGLLPVPAIAKAFDQLAALFAASGSEVIAQREADLRDVESRLLRCWHKVPERDLTGIGSPCVLVAQELFPSDVLALGGGNVAGIATERGGEASHAAIISRQLGIAAVVGVDGLMGAVEDGVQVVVDGVDGAVVLSPGEEALARFREKQRLAEGRRRGAEAFRDVAAVTQDGTRISVKANVSGLGDDNLQVAECVDGVGLLRTEFLFLDRRDLPGEDEQYRAYRRALELYRGKPVVLRTADFGADKQPAALPAAHEDNPALGIRGVRLSMAHPDLFGAQVRAALRASAEGPLKLMFPMVTTLEEFGAAKRFVLEQGAELDRRGVPWDRGIAIGAMVETPALALVPEGLAREADFASVGTNDLVQYTCAADRTNGGVAGSYQQLHPAVLRLIAGLASAFAEQGKDLSICGELAGDWRASSLLVGLGVRSLSMSASSIAQVKQAVCSSSRRRCADLARAALAATTEAQVLGLLEDYGRRETAGPAE